MKGYHCWAEFYVKGKGWIPVDASDASKTTDRGARAIPLRQSRSGPRPVHGGPRPGADAADRPSRSTTSSIRTPRRTERKSATPSIALEYRSVPPATQMAIGLICISSAVNLPDHFTLVRKNFGLCSNAPPSGFCIAHVLRADRCR